MDLDKWLKDYFNDYLMYFVVAENSEFEYENTILYYKVLYKSYKSKYNPSIQIKFGILNKTYLIKSALRCIPHTAG